MSFSSKNGDLFEKTKGSVAFEIITIKGSRNLFVGFLIYFEKNSVHTF